MNKKILYLNRSYNCCLTNMLTALWLLEVSRSTITTSLHVANETIVSLSNSMEWIRYSLIRALDTARGIFWGEKSGSRWVMRTRVLLLPSVVFLGCLMNCSMLGEEACREENTDLLWIGNWDTMFSMFNVWAMLFYCGRLNKKPLDSKRVWHWVRPRFESLTRSPWLHHVGI